MVRRLRQCGCGNRRGLNFWKTREKVSLWNSETFWVISSHFSTEVRKYEPSDGYLRGAVTCIITSLDTSTQTWAWAWASVKIWRGIGSVCRSRTGWPAEQESAQGCPGSASQNCSILRRLLCHLISVVQFKLYDWMHFSPNSPKYPKCNKAFSPKIMIFSRMLKTGTLLNHISIKGICLQTILMQFLDKTCNLSICSWLENVWTSAVNVRSPRSRVNRRITR